jgi:hypothetical protein
MEDCPRIYSLLPDCWYLDGGLVDCSAFDERHGAPSPSLFIVVITLSGIDISIVSAWLVPTALFGLLGGDCII